MTASLQIFLRKLRQQVQAAVANEMLLGNFFLEFFKMPDNKLPNTDEEISALGFTGTELISQERNRQKFDEGYFQSIDDEYTDHQLVCAAIAYASHYPVMISKTPGTDNWIDPWPWNKAADKRARHCKLKRLVIAGALIAAEIDRIQHQIEKESHNEKTR